MSNYYLDSGFVNARVWFDDPAPFVIALGGRGIGKTFGALEILTEDGAPKHIYMRRTQAQIDACKIGELNPYKSVNDYCKRSFIMTAMGKYTAGVYRGEEKDGALKPVGAPVGLGIALSVFANIRGVDGLGYRVLLFDEFIKERHERPFAREGEAFLNAYETLNRNREIQGGEPLKAILLSNSNDLRSPILEALGVVDLIDKMNRRGKHHGTAAGGAISVYLYPDSPISERKKDTALYKVANSADFEAMALDNKFSAANYENVKSCPLREYTPLVSVGGVTVYSHINNGTFYVVEGVKSPLVYTTLPNDMKAFKRAYIYLYDALLRRELYYSSAPVKVRFERVWE